MAAAGLGGDRTGARQQMKLRIDIEKKSYEATVEFLDDAHTVIGTGSRPRYPSPSP